MKVEYSKAFVKAASKLTGKYKASFQEKIKEVKSANTIEEVSGCKKLEGFENTYRLRIGMYRAFFIFKTTNMTICFEYLVNRGKAYSKEYTTALRKKEKSH